MSKNKRQLIIFNWLNNVRKMKRIAILFITKSPNSWHETFSTLKALRKFYCTSEPPLYFLYQTLWTGPMSLSLISLAVIITLGRSAPEFIPLSQAPSADHLYSTTVHHSQASILLPGHGHWLSLPSPPILWSVVRISPPRHGAGLTTSLGAVTIAFAQQVISQLLTVKKFL